MYSNNLNFRLALDAIAAPALTFQHNFDLKVLPNKHGAQENTRSTRLSPLPAIKPHKQKLNFAVGVHGLAAICSPIQPISGWMSP
jgi:hypothetical protein